MNRLLPAACLILCLAAPAAAQPVAAPPVMLVAPLEAGQVLRYTLVASIDMTRDQVAGRHLEQTARLRLHVAEIDSAGAATVRAAFESLSARWRTGEEAAQAFDWKEGQELDPEAPALAGLYGSLATSPLEFIVAPDGSISRASGPEKAVASAENEREASLMLGALAPGSIATTLSPVFRLDPDRKPRSRGDRWTTTTEVPAIGAAGIRIDVERTLDQLTATEARLSCTIAHSSAAPGAPDPTEPRLIPSNQRGQGAERWNTTTGRLIYRSQEHSATWTFELQTTPPIRASRTIKSRIELTQAPPLPVAPPAPPPPGPPPAPAP